MLKMQNRLIFHKLPDHLIFKKRTHRLL